MALEDGYKCVFEGGVGEYEEKKSRFIASVRPVETEEEAVSFINEMKKKYWDARHNCSAFVIGEKAQLTRCSDDGEPAGTAGRPMLEVLLGEEVRNVAVVVTRYFGGTLLGTGGLVRAYTKSVQAGLQSSRIIEKKKGRRLIVGTDYNGVGKLQYLFGREGYTVENSDYGSDVVFTLLLTLDQYAQAKNKIIEATNGQAKLEDGDETIFALIDGEVMIF